MAPLEDPRLVAAIHNALEEGLRFSGYVTWNQRSQQAVRTELPGYTTKAVAEMMYEHVAEDGKVDQVRETREEYLEHRFHYDFRIEIEGRKMYIQTVLLNDDPDDPELHVVNLHPA